MSSPLLRPRTLKTKARNFRFWPQAPGRLTAWPFSLQDLRSSSGGPGTTQASFNASPGPYSKKFSVITLFSAPYYPGACHSALARHIVASTPCWLQSALRCGSVPVTTDPPCGLSEISLTRVASCALQSLRCVSLLEPSQVVSLSSEASVTSRVAPNLQACLQLKAA